MIRIRSIFPPPKRDQAILTDPCFFPKRRFCKLTHHSEMPLHDSLFITKAESRKRCFYDKKAIELRKILSKEDELGKVLSAKALGKALSEKEIQTLKEGIVFDDISNGETKKIKLSVETIFSYFLKFKEIEVSDIILEGCLESRLIRPFLTLYKKLELEEEKQSLQINEKQIKYSLFVLFSSLKPKEYLKRQIEFFEKKNKDLYFKMYEKYEKVPFYENAQNSNQQNDPIIIKVDDDKANTNPIDKITFMNKNWKSQKVVDKSKKSKEREDSLIRLRFKENLRKQLRRLSNEVYPSLKNSKN